MEAIYEPDDEQVKDIFDYQDTRIFKPTQKALDNVLKCKISKKVRKILETLYADYYCD